MVFVIFEMERTMETQLLTTGKKFKRHGVYFVKYVGIHSSVVLISVDKYSL